MRVKDIYMCVYFLLSPEDLFDLAGGLRYGTLHNTSENWISYTSIRNKLSKLEGIVPVSHQCPVEKWC